MSLEELAKLTQQLKQQKSQLSSPTSQNQTHNQTQNEDKLLPKSEPLKILFICTHNRCRSILSEAITNQIAAGLIEAQSAGSHPAEQVHPLTLEYLASCGYDVSGLHSKSWQSMADSFSPDVVIMVCDQAAGESCPLWLGTVPKLHWGLADPSKLAASSLVVDKQQASEVSTNKLQSKHNQQIAHAFCHCIAAIESRVVQLMSIALLPPKQRIDALNAIINDSNK